MPVNAAEAVAMSMGKEPKVAAAPSPEAVVAQKLRVRKQERGWREVAKDASGEPLDTGKLGLRVEEMGMERDPKTGAKIRTPGTPETQRYDKTKEYRDLGVKLATVDFDTPESKGGFTVAEKKILRAAARDRILRRSDLAKRFNGFALEKERQDFVDAYLKDSKLQGSVKEGLNAIANEPGFGTDVEDKADAVRQNQFEIDNKGTEITDIDRRIGSVDSQLKAFARPKDRTKWGKSADDLDTFRTNKQPWEQDIATRRKEIVKLKQREADLVAERDAGRVPGAKLAPGRTMTKIEGELAQARTDQGTAQDEIDDKQGKINSISSLEEQERSLEEQKRGLQTERGKTKVDLDKLNLELGKRQRQFSDAQRLRDSQEETLRDKLGAITGEALDKIMDEETDALLADVDNVIAESSKEEMDATQKAFIDSLHEYQYKVVTTRRWGKTYTRRVVDKRNNDTLYAGMLSNNPEEVMTYLMTKAINPTTKANYTPAEAAAIVKDPKFAETMKPQFVTEVLARKLRTDGGFSRQDVNAITDTDWGKGMIMKAYENEEGVRKQIDEAFGKGAIKDPGFFRRFARESGKWSSILAIILAMGVPVAWDAHTSGRSYA